ncbi:hypothetical protein EDD22DRAFT_986181 [Suillus occidentalis]|nr:hypothetical protein EDD22DRAFT_986181 [Suillus occidentalis]
MASKHISKATSKALTMKAKASGILSGISCSVSGVVSIGSMVSSINQLQTPLFMQEDPIEDMENMSCPLPPVIPKDVSTAGPTTAATTAAFTPPARYVHISSFCHFCCDTCSPPSQHKCVECSAIIYKQTAEEVKYKPLFYTFIGFKRRKKVKMTWPMAIINLGLESMKDDYLTMAITLKVQNHYRFNPANGAAHVVKSRKLMLGMAFFWCNFCAGFLPNVFIVIDTHSNEFSGMLQHTGGHSSDVEWENTLVQSHCEFQGRMTGIVHGVFGRTDIWAGLCDLLASSNEFLDYTTAVVVYATTVTGWYSFSADTGFIDLWYLSLQIQEEGGASAQLKINEQQRQIAECDRQLEEGMGTGHRAMMWDGRRWLKVRDWWWLAWAFNCQPRDEAAFVGMCWVFAHGAGCWRSKMGVALGDDDNDEMGSEGVEIGASDVASDESCANGGKGCGLAEACVKGSTFCSWAEEV